MSEVKRTKLIPIGAERVNIRGTKESGKTIRIAVILPESTEDKCPEFNYKDLVTATKKKREQKNSVPIQTNGSSPFTEDHKDMRTLSDKMEARYGLGTAKKRKWRKDDYADIGMGYDESDSFIDNTDGYDEIIPRNVTTLHGGFYINCGALEFKTDENASSDESSSSEDVTAEKSSARKRIIESSAESEEDLQTDQLTNEKHTEKKPKLVLNPNGMQKAIKKRLFSHEKIKQQIRKNHADEAKKTVKELLKERRVDLNMSVSDTETPEKTDPLVTVKENKLPASVDDVIESVINSVTTTPKSVVSDESSKDSVGSKDGVTISVVNSSEPESNDDGQTKTFEIVHLPENLPSDIIGIIESIKAAAKYSTEGKVKFFSGEVNTMLLSLERKCRCLGKQSHMKVYEHLAPFVKCRKETLMKRAKNLCAVEEQKKIKILLNRLKASVGAIMPGLIANYETECKAIIQKKFSPQVEENVKNLRMPKRQFLWNDDIRKLVKDIITLRKKCFLNEGKRKDSLEKHLTEFIKTEVHVIWPDGWMSMNSLLKYCSFTPAAKKIVDNIGKPTLIPSEISISPSTTNIISTSTTVSPSIVSISNSITTPNITLNSSSALTITPVTSVHKVVNSEIKVKSKLTNINETTLSKINSDNSSVSKSSKTSPAVEILKSSHSDLNTAKYPISLTTSNNREGKSLLIKESTSNSRDGKLSLIKETTSNSRENKSLIIKDDLEAIIIEDTSVRKKETENLSSSIINAIKPQQLLDNTRNHCQIIDLTDTPDIKRKPNSKTKPKYPFEFSDMLKISKEPTEHVTVKPKEELTGSSALSQLISDSLNESSRFTQTIKSLNAPLINHTSESVTKKSSNSLYDFPNNKAKPTNEGDDIQKVMEGLKVLHKMSSPVKSNDEIKRSSPVSVIAFNKSYLHDSSSSHATTVTPHRTNSFQDMFQKHITTDYSLKPHVTQPSKGNQNSISIHNHSSNKITAANERYLQNSNNNYAQANSNQMKNNCSPQQQGSCTLMDDMYANLLSEYGFSKTVNSKSSSQHK